MRGLLKRYAGDNEADEPEVGVASLVDVGFLLLIFFLATTTILKQERDLKISMLPEGPSASELIPTVIEVRSGGEIVLNPGPREFPISSDPKDHTLAALRDRLEQVKDLGAVAAPLYVIRAHDEATQQRVVDVLNCLQGAGIERVSFQDW